MTTRKKTNKDYKTIFQITQIDQDKYVLVSVLTEKQLDTLMSRLEKEFEPHSRKWRYQYQALAKAIVTARDNLEKQ